MIYLNKRNILPNVSQITISKPTPRWPAANTTEKPDPGFFF